ncbi:MAG TPA: glycosyltransferase [Terriglobia bacterium]|jgi:glycosyltransferase involved in cell wall biosynthesis|nr:glycosyltransferase [Terriglobia bacterium]
MQNSHSAARLRVLVCAFACSPGGGPASLAGGGEAVLGWNIVRQLARFHEVVVLTHAELRSAIESGLKEAFNGNIHFHYLKLPRWLEALKGFAGGIQFYAYLWQIKAYFVARRLHRERPFDVFHHVTYANDWMASYIGALLPVPYIRGPGGGAQRVPKAFLAGFSRRGRFWEHVRSVGQQVLRHDPIFMLGQRRARAILVCTPESLFTIPERWRTKAQLFPVNGITSEDLRLTERNNRADSPTRVWPHENGQFNGSQKPFRVLSAGKLLELKAFDLAIRAFQLFVQKAPTATFTLIGDGPESGRLRKLTQELGLDGKVRIEKWMSREELLQAMAQSDVFLFASLRDGGGAVVIEAMAAGMPVVCLDHAGPAMHVTEKCGIKVQPRHPDQAIKEMAEALFCLYRDAELRLQMGKAARERAERSYHWERHGDCLLEVYRRVLHVEGDLPARSSEHAESIATTS